MESNSSKGQEGASTNRHEGKEAAVLCLLIIFVSFLPGGRFMAVPDGVR